MTKERNITQDIDIYSAVDSYMRDIRSIKLLTVDEEIKYGQILDKNRKIIPSESKNVAAQVILTEEGLDARNKFIEGNLRLVVDRAKQRVNRGIQFSDLIGAGNTGLIRAAELFDVKKGWKFSTYATYWIDRYINLITLKESHEIHLPIRKRELLNKISYAKSVLVQKLNRQPNTEEIANFIGTNKKTIEESKRYPKVTRSLNEPVSDDEDAEIIDLIPSNEENSPEKIIENKEIYEMIDRLSPLSQQIIKLNCGFKNGECMEDREISKKLGIDIEIIRKNKKQAIRILRTLQQSSTVKE